MFSFTDQLNRTVTLPDIPQRIISLVPSQTELLYDLGLEKEVIGITKFCVHPNKWFRSKTRIGGTKTIKIEMVRELQPDLIIANKEENVKEQVDELAKEFPVWISDINNLQHSQQMIAAIGAITGRQEKAASINATIAGNFSQLDIHPAKTNAAYLIWRNPYMTIGGDTFISDMMKHCGLNNIFENDERYPVTSVEQLRERNCELLLLSSEPFPFKEKHVEELQVQLPGTTILLVDGEMFSWYGSRLMQAPAYFNKLLK